MYIRRLRRLSLGSRMSQGSGRLPVRPFHLRRSDHSVRNPPDPQDDARKIVSWNKYPPKGTRGFGPMFSAHSFSVTEADYPSEADDNLLVIVQIESKDGVKNVEEIAAVEGIDVLFIGESSGVVVLRTGL